jgi:polyisoprenoid-binding protein YceI
MALPAGSTRFGPDNASLEVRTYREGMAAKVGHDLVLDVGRWEATLDVPADPGDAKVTLQADARSLQVREGLRGVKPLTDKDRAEIVRNIDEKVHGGQPISFVSRSVRLEDGGARLVAEGDLTMAGTTRPLTTTLILGDDGRAHGTVTLRQSEWGIKPYRGLMGALKVRDDVEVVIDASLAAGP